MKKRHLDWLKKCEQISEKHQISKTTVQQFQNILNEFKGEENE